MKIIQEITDWTWPNHTYFVSDSRDRLYGYVRERDGAVVKLSKPIQFNVSGRKFTEIPENSWGFAADEAAQTPSSGRTWSVQGSRGDVYTVTQEGLQFTCSCAGYKFRSRCRHTEDVAKKLLKI